MINSVGFVCEKVDSNEIYIIWDKDYFNFIITGETQAVEEETLSVSLTLIQAKQIADLITRIYNTNELAKLIIRNHPEASNSSQND